MKIQEVSKYKIDFFITIFFFWQVNFNYDNDNTTFKQGAPIFVE